MKVTLSDIVLLQSIFLHIFKINVVEVKDRLEHRPRISSENMYCLSTDQACKFGHRKINYV